MFHLHTLLVLLHCMLSLAGVLASPCLRPWCGSGFAAWLVCCQAGACLIVIFIMRVIHAPQAVTTCGCSNSSILCFIVVSTSYRPTVVHCCCHHCAVLPMARGWGSYLTPVLLCCCCTTNLSVAQAGSRGRGLQAAWSSHKNTLCAEILGGRHCLPCAL